MPSARALALLLLTSACATVQGPDPVSAPGRAPAAPSGALIQRVDAPAGNTAGAPSGIGATDIARARNVLTQARNQLEPRHWKLLDGKLGEAERAFERFQKIASASGRTAQVARGAPGWGNAPRTAGPWLALLVLLWPAETAGPEHDDAPEWLIPKLELEDKLREVSRAAQQVQAELDAAHGVPVEAARRNRPPRPNVVRIHDESWKREPEQLGNPPCIFRGGSGPAMSPGWIRCDYVCGRYQVILYDVFGSSTADCEKSAHIERAQKEAQNWARVHDEEW